MTGPSPGRLRRYAAKCFALESYLRSPGDGRRFPQIPAPTLLWSLLVSRLLRAPAYHAVEGLVRSPARRALEVERAFGDDAVAYFTERLDPGPTRRAHAAVLRRAKRNKAFDDTTWIVVVLDGTGGARCRAAPCPLCHPSYDSEGEVVSYFHRLSLLTIVAGDWVLPADGELYGPGDSEVTTSARLLQRAVGHLGRRFADCVVLDAEYAGAPFLHLVGELGLPVVARLKDNLPELSNAARARFEGQPPITTVVENGERIELWDADDFEPWGDLNWLSVRVLRYRQYHRNGKVTEAYWLTNLSPRRAGSRILFRLCKSRWCIENQGFNDAKNRYGLEHMAHHHPNSLLIDLLLLCLALTLERLYRLRYLRRGHHAPYTAVAFCRLLWISLGRSPVLFDTS